MAGGSAEACIEGVDAGPAPPRRWGLGAALGGLWRALGGMSRALWRALHWTDLIAFPLAAVWGCAAVMLLLQKPTQDDDPNDYDVKQEFMMLAILAVPTLSPLIFRASFQARAAAVFSCEPTGRYFTRTYALGWIWLINLLIAFVKAGTLRCPQCILQEPHNPLWFSAIVVALDAVEFLGSAVCISQLINCLSYPVALLYLIPLTASTFAQAPDDWAQEMCFSLLNIIVHCVREPLNRALEEYLGWHAFWCIVFVLYGLLACSCLQSLLAWREAEKERRHLREGMILCCICLSRLKTVCIVPCLHKALCHSCADLGRFCDPETRPFSRCPICREQMRMPYFMDARVVSEIQTHKRQIYHT